MQNKNRAVITSFLIPMLLSGFIIMPLTVVLVIGGIMRGWSDLLMLLPIAAILLLSISPRHLLRRYGVNLPFHPMTLFFISLLFNISVMGLVLFLLSLFSK